MKTLTKVIEMSKREMNVNMYIFLRKLQHSFEFNKVYKSEVKIIFTNITQPLFKITMNCTSSP